MKTKSTVLCAVQENGEDNNNVELAGISKKLPDDGRVPCLISYKLSNTTCTSSGESATLFEIRL